MPTNVGSKLDESKLLSEEEMNTHHSSQFWHMTIMADHLDCHSKNTWLDDHGRRSVPQELCRKVWNSCIGEELTEDQKRFVLANSEIPASDFDPLSDKEISLIADILEDRFPDSHPPSLSNVNLDKIDLSGGMDCSGFVFVNFSMCNSDVSRAGFDGAIFLGACQMEDTIFREDTGFESAHFGSGVSFRKSTFDHVLFSEACFGPAQFIDVKFLDSVIFERARFIGEARFHNSKFRDLTIFSKVEFRSEPPQFYGATIHEDTDFSTIAWPTTYAEPDRHLRAYECLKRLVGEQKKYRLEHYFLQKEMACQEKCDGPIYALPSKTFKLLSDYGWSYSRPAISLLISWLLGAFGFVVLTCKFSPFTLQVFINCAPTAFALSFSNLFGFLGIGRTLMSDELQALDGNRVAETLAGAQMIAGPLLLFLLILGFRNRFRMK